LPWGITTARGRSTLTTIRTRSKSGKPRILIAGLGNLLLTDDGVGVHAVRELQKDRLPSAMLAVEVGAAVLDALHLFEWADVVVGIDAMQAGGPPGTIYKFGVEDVENRGVSASLHELGLLAALNLISPEARPDVVILGVEPEVIDYGLELSPAVQRALPRLVEAARDIAERLARPSPPLP
jgi:hydrogenase maturation protease